MNIFIKIKNSFYNPDYYNEIIKKPFSYSLKYYLLFALLFAVVFAGVITIKFIPVEKVLENKIPGFVDYFPQKLEIKIENGKASTNAPEPFFVKLPENFKKETGVKDFENIIVINTKNKFSLENFAEYKTFALLTSDSIAYVNDKNQITITSLKNAGNFIVNRQNVESITNKIKPFLKWLYPIIFTGSYVAGFFLVFSILAYLLVGALLIWIVAWAKGLKINYGKSFQLGLHLLAAPIIITGIVNFLPLDFKIPFLLTILLILSSAINLRKAVENT